MFPVDKEAPLFITGATGFLGSHTARAFHKAGYSNLHLLARDPKKLDVVSDVPHTVVHGDLLVPDTWKKPLQEAEGVIHLAADYSMDARDATRMTQVNVDAARTLAQSSVDAGIKRFIHCSSVAAIGREPGSLHSDETVEWNLGFTNDPYTRSKYEGEQAVKEVLQAGLPGLVLNPSAPIGPDDVKPTPTGQMIVDVLNRRVPGYFEGGFNMVDVEDVAAGFALAYEKGRDGESYILGGQNLTLRQIFNMISDVSGVPPPKIKLPKWAVVPSASMLTWWSNLIGIRSVLHPGGAAMVMLPPWYDDTKARLELGYESRTFRAAMERAVLYIYKRGWATPPANSPMRPLLGLRS